MKDLLAIMAVEKKSLLRGFLAVFMLAFPFTFLPAIIRNGLSMQFIWRRVPDSILYAALIAAAVLVIALLNNYEKLLNKKRLFSYPAFTALNFYGGVERYDSIIKEISTYLIGRVGNYFFKVDILHPDKPTYKIALSPLIDLPSDSSLIDRLQTDLKLKENLYLSRIIFLSEEQLLEKTVLKNELLVLSDELTQLGVVPAEAPRL